MCDPRGSNFDPKFLKSMVKISQPENAHTESALLPDSFRGTRDPILLWLFAVTMSVADSCPHYLCLILVL